MKRLAKIDRAERELADQHKVQFGQRRVVGLSWKALWEQIALSVAPESLDVMMDIVEQVAAHREQAKRDGKSMDDGHNWHPFDLWLSGLTVGWCTLPERIPPEVLIAYRDWKFPKPVPRLRCDDCHMALPWAMAATRIFPCPVCGSKRQFYAAFYGRFGETWIDPRA